MAAESTLVESSLQDVAASIAPYFEVFRFDSGQLRVLAHWIAQEHRFLVSITDRRELVVGEYPDIATLALSLASDEELSKLSTDSFMLLKQCHRRVWAFSKSPESQYWCPPRRSYGELFGVLVSLGLVVEATPRQKLRASHTVVQLRGLLAQRGLPGDGKKDELVERLTSHLSTEESQDLVANVMLFVTTQTGQDTLAKAQGYFDTFGQALSRALPAVREAVTAYDRCRRSSNLSASTLGGHSILSRETLDGVVRAITVASGGHLWVSRLLDSTDSSDHDSSSVMWPPAGVGVVLAGFVKVDAESPWFIHVYGIGVEALSDLGFSRERDQPDLLWAMKAVSSIQTRHFSVQEESHRVSHIALEVGSDRDGTLWSRVVDQEEVIDTILRVFSEIFGLDSGQPVRMTFKTYQ